MLKLTKLSKSFWGEAVNIAVYLINRSPSILLDFDIPQRVWTGKAILALEGLDAKHSCMYQRNKERSLMIK